MATMEDYATLARRPDANNWAAKEIVRHLRDTEERQYLRNDATEAAAAFRRRRQESLAFLRKLTPEQWSRGHLDQLKRALDGKP